MVIVLEFGVIGAAISLFLTNLVIYTIQRYKISQISELKEANSVRLCDARNVQNMFQYLKLAVQSFLFTIIEWSAHDALTIMAGILGTRAAGS
jgi:hypothetical protein